MAKLLATRYGYCTECHETFEYNLYEDKEDGNFTDISRGEFLVHGEHMGIGYKTEADAQVAMEREIADDLEEALSFNPNLVGWEALINCLIEEAREATTETANTMDKAVKPMASKQVTLSETRDNIIRTLAIDRNDGYEWTDSRGTWKKMAALEKLGLIVSRITASHTYEYQLTDAGRDYATAHGWLAPTPAETAPEAATPPSAPDERGVGDAPTFAVGETVYGVFLTGEIYCAKITRIELGGDAIIIGGAGYDFKSERLFKSIEAAIEFRNHAVPNHANLISNPIQPQPSFVQNEINDVDGYMRPCDGCEGNGTIYHPDTGYYQHCDMCDGTGVYTDADDLRAELDASREREAGLRALLGRFVEYLHGYDLISIVEEYAAYDDTDQQIGAVLLRDVLRQALDASAKE
jgi:hypothetical protein